MTTKRKDPVLVVLQLTGGNDYFNTVIPYTDGNYFDSRPRLQIPEDRVIKIDDELGMHPAMGPMKQIYESGDMAIIHGVGYENSPRSHFRSMDIWHTCEPDKVGTEGWLGRALREIDPEGENPVTGVNIGQALPRALVAPGVSVASVADVSTYGLLSGVQEKEQRAKMLTALRQHVRPRGRHRAGDGVPGPDRHRRDEGRGHAEGGPRGSTSLQWSTPAPPSPGSCVTSR